MEGTLSASEFVSLLRDAVAGIAPAEAAVAVAAEFRAQVEQARAVFAQVSAGAPAVRREVVEEAYRALDEALRGIRDEISDTSILTFEQGVSNLREALQAYDALSMTDGPSPYPVHNALARAASAARGGQISSEAFRRILGAAREQLARVEQGLAGDAAVAADALGPVSDAIAACVAAVDEMESFLSDGDANHLFLGLERLDAAHGDLEASLAAYRQARFESGPTTSSVANVFIVAAAQVASGEYAADTFRANLETLDACVDRMRRNLEEAAASVSLQAQVPFLQAALACHEAALDAYRRGLDADPAALEEGSAHLVEGARHLDAAAEAQRPGSFVLCPRCGSVNAVEAEACGQCQGIMPHAGPASLDDVVLTDNVRRLLDDVNRIANGAITPVAFQATLDWMEGVAAETERGLARTGDVRPEQFAEDEQEQAEAVARLVDETKELLAEGIQAMRAALGELRGYLAAGDPACLSRGLCMFWEACRTVSHSERTARMGASRFSMDQAAVAALPDDEEAFDLREAC